MATSGIFKFFRNFRYRLFCWLLDDALRKKVSLQTFGDICPWTLHSGSLKQESTVLSAGAGNDISFEQELVEKIGVKLVLLDPSPTGKICVEKTGILAKNFHFLPAALASKDGVIYMREPQDPVEGSYVAVSDSSKGDSFESKSVASLMRENGWNQIDLLKIDIEGSEYEVVDHVLQKKLNVKQICVEFHYGPEFHVSRLKMLGSILKLIAGGYDMIHRAGMDYTFLKREA